MFLDLFPGHLIGLVHDSQPRHNQCREEVALKDGLVEKAKSSGYGVFFTPNGHGRVVNPDGKLWRWDGNVNRLNACFADFDKGSKAAQMATIRGMPLVPTLIVESKRGYHTYWLLKDCPVTKASVSLWRRLQTTIAEKYGADKACSNPSRLLRLPGSWHVKGESFLVSVHELNDQNYTLEEIELAFPPKPRVVFVPGSARGMKRIEVPVLVALREGERHPALKSAAARLYANSKPEDTYAIRQALKSWYSLSCVNLKDDWEKEVDSVCAWFEKREGQV